MVLITLMADQQGGEALVEIMKDLFRAWGDQVASQEGDGMLVSMWYFHIFSWLILASRQA